MPGSQSCSNFRLPHAGCLVLAWSLASACGGKEATGPVAALIATDPGTVSLKGIGTTQTVRATVQDARSLEIAGQGVRWSSANSTIASVTQTGNTATVTAVAPGVTQAIATTTNGSVSQSVTVTVIAEVNSVTTSVSSATLNPDNDATRQVTATANADPGVTVTYSWGSSNTAVASVTAIPGGTAIINAVAPGQATITVTAQGQLGGPSRTAQVAVTVSPTLQSLTNLILNTHRDAQASYIIDLGVLGREVYNWSAPGARGTLDFVTGTGGRLDPAGLGGGQWTGRFANMRNALALYDLAAGSSIPAGQRLSAQGFALTMLALEWLQVAQTRDTLGGPTEVDRNTSRVVPWGTAGEVYTAIRQRLDSARTLLQFAGSTFPFALPGGWVGYDTPGTFLRFNRALYAKASVLHASVGCGFTCYQSAQVALNEAFIPSGGSMAQLDAGPHHTFTGSSGNQNGASFAVNGFLYAHPNVFANVQAGDDRAVRKLVALGAPVAAPYASTVSTTRRFGLYASGSASLPIIRNEELVLLEAELKLMFNDLASATARINQVRTVSGMLPPIPMLPSAQLLDALLYERRMSLLFEGARWVDLRRFGRLGTLPIDRPGEIVAAVMPIPTAECNARNPKPAGC